MAGCVKETKQIFLNLKRKLEYFCNGPEVKKINLNESFVHAEKSEQFLHKAQPSTTKLEIWLNIWRKFDNKEKSKAIEALVEQCDNKNLKYFLETIEPLFKIDFISLLPEEISIYILSYLSPYDLLQASLTCKIWNIYCNSNWLWRNKCLNAGTEKQYYINNRYLSWKGTFERQHKIENCWRFGSYVRHSIYLSAHDDHIITCLQFDGDYIITGSNDTTLKVWSVHNAACIYTLNGHKGGVWCSGIIPSDEIIISGSTDRTIKIWNYKNGSCINTLTGHTNIIRCLAVHDKTIVSGSRDTTIKLWDLATFQCLATLRGHTASVRCIQYNGKFIISGSYDNLVIVWNPKLKIPIYTLNGHKNKIYSLKFDGINIISGSLDTTINIWDVYTGRRVHTLKGHANIVNTLKLKNNILASGNADNTVKIWNINTGKCIHTLRGHNSYTIGITHVDFNNKFVITSSDDGTVKLWDIKSGKFIRNILVLPSSGFGGIIWKIRVTDTKLICATGCRNNTEESKLHIFNFDDMFNDQCG